MAFEGTIAPVVGKGDTAMGTLRHHTTVTALEVGGEAAPIDQNETLFLTLQAGGNGLIEWCGNDPLIRCGVGALIDHRNTG
jgi:hypothetical protein